MMGVLLSQEMKGKGNADIMSLVLTFLSTAIYLLFYCVRICICFAVKADAFDFSWVKIPLTMNNIFCSYILTIIGNQRKVQGLVIYLENF